MVDEVITDKNAIIVSFGGFIIMGDYLRIKENSFIQVNSLRMEIGDCVFTNCNCTIVCREKMIGDERFLGPDVTQYGITTIGLMKTLSTERSIKQERLLLKKDVGSVRELLFFAIHE